MTPGYVEAVLSLYTQLPDTPLRATAQDHWFACQLHDQGVPLPWSNPR